MTFNPGENPVLTILYNAEGGNDVKTQSNFLIIVLD